MIWERSDVIALAKEGCTRCGGSGFHTWNSTWVCDCVRRGVFRACYERFKHCAKSYSTGGVRYELVSGAVNSPRAFGRKNSEYIIDFELIAKRTLTEQEYKLFRYHFLLGAEWKLCCRRLNMERGSFYHAVYRIQQKLGRAFRETQPYALFPLDEYFGGSVRVERTASKVVKEPAKALRPPLRSLPVAA